MSFFDSMFGKSQGRDMANAYGASRAELQAGTDQGIAAYNKGADEAKGYYAPWAERGAKQQNVYEDSLGLNGEAGGRNALMTYQNGANPHLGYEQDMAQKAIERSANARGGLNTGYTALASARARQGLGYQDYQGWQNRLMQGGQMGYGADQARAGIAQQAGQYAGDARMGLGQQLAGNAINYGNAQASNRMTGINNLMRIGGLVVSAQGNMAKAASGGKGGQGD
jgi:hypothetical protein